MAAAEAGMAFAPWVGTNLAEILCVHQERIVTNDNTVRYQGRSLQIPPGAHRFHYVKATVRVHAYPNGTLAVFHGSRCLGATGPMVSCSRPSRPYRAKEGIPIIGRPIDRGSWGHCVHQNFGAWLKTSAEKNNPDRSCATYTTGQLNLPSTSAKFFM